MMQLLHDELKLIGLETNLNKTKVLTNDIQFAPDGSFKFIEVDGDFVEVLAASRAHKYMGAYDQFGIR